MLDCCHLEGVVLVCRLCFARPFLEAGYDFWCLKRLSVFAGVVWAVPRILPCMLLPALKLCTRDRLRGELMAMHSRKTGLPCSRVSTDRAAPGEHSPW